MFNLLILCIHSSFHFWWYNFFLTSGHWAFFMQSHQVYTCLYIVTFLPHPFLLLWTLEIASCPEAKFIIFYFCLKISFPGFLKYLFLEIHCHIFAAVTPFLPHQSWTPLFHFCFHPNCLPPSDSEPVLPLVRVNYTVNPKMLKMH